MLIQKFFTNLALTILICLPLGVQANSDITRIGISVVIKGDQNCDYSYALENKIDLRTIEQNHFFNCDINDAKLQQQANLITAASNTTNNNIRINDQNFRIFKTVQ